jgi:CheY-like chemotaxis protein
MAITRIPGGNQSGIHLERSVLQQAEVQAIQGRQVLRELRGGASVAHALRRAMCTWSEFDELMSDPQFALECMATQDAKFASRALRLASLADSALEVLEEAIAARDRSVALELLKELKITQSAAMFTHAPGRTADSVRRLLLIEDEVPLRKLISGHFRKAGYEVDDAGSAEEVLLAGALVDIHSKRPAVDCLLLDINLPGVSGPLLGQMVRDAWPDTPIVFMSGDPHATEADESAPRLQAPLVMKPFDLKHLEQVVESAIFTQGAA